MASAQSLLGTLTRLGSLLVGVLLSALLSRLMARWISRRIVALINALNLEAPLQNRCCEEFAPLLRRMDRQSSEIRSNMLEMRDMQTKRNAITQNMREGLILLDGARTVLSMNSGAAAIFGVRERVQCDLLSISCSATVRETVFRALAGESADALLEREGCLYQNYGNPVLQADKVDGVMLLLWDITERQLAGQSRQKFSANASHERKTPLTSIFGCAEIIRDGRAVPFFAGKIHSEAAWLITLINDIMEFSRLDEHRGLQERSRADLLAAALEDAQRFENAARKKEIQFTVQGESVHIAVCPVLLLKCWRATGICRLAARNVVGAPDVQHQGA